MTYDKIIEKTVKREGELRKLIKEKQSEIEKLELEKLELSKELLEIDKLLIRHRSAIH